MAEKTLPFEIRLEWDPDDHVWVSHVPCLNHLSTFGKTYSQAWEMTREAIALYLEVALEDNDPLPFPRSQAEEVLAQLTLAEAVV